MSDMAERFDAEDVAEVMRHLDDLEARYRELGDVEASLRDALRNVRRTRAELLQTLRRLDRLDAERAVSSSSVGERDADAEIDGEPAEAAGPGLAKAASVQRIDEARLLDGSSRKR